MRSPSRRTRRRRAALAALVGLAAVAMLTSCASAKTSGTQTAADTADVPEASRTVPPVGDLQLDGIIGMSCSGMISSGNTLTLNSISTTASDRVTGSRTIQLPEDASLAYSCTSSGGLLRTMFDEDYSRVAVTIALDDGSRHVGFVDTKTGALTDLESSSDADSFSSTLEDHAPVFGRDGGIWFKSDQGNQWQVKRIPANGGQAVPVNIPKVWFGRSFMLTGDSQKVIETGPLSNPSGTAVVDAEGFGVLKVYSADSVNAAPPSRSTPLATLTGKTIGEPVVWTDDRTVITQVDIGTSQNSAASTFRGIRLSADFRTIAQEHQLLPSTNRTNRSPVASPDGSSIAFISRSGETAEVFVTAVSTSAETNPKRVLPAAPSTLLEWR